MDHLPSIQRKVQGAERRPVSVVNFAGRKGCRLPWLDALRKQLRREAHPIPQPICSQVLEPEFSEWDKT